MIRRSISAIALVVASVLCLIACASDCCISSAKIECVYPSLFMPVLSCGNTMSMKLVVKRKSDGQPVTFADGSCNVNLYGDGNLSFNQSLCGNLLDTYYPDFTGSQIKDGSIVVRDFYGCNARCRVLQADPRTLSFYFNGCNLIIRVRMNTLRSSRYGTCIDCPCIS